MVTVDYLRENQGDLKIKYYPVGSVNSNFSFSRESSFPIRIPGMALDSNLVFYDTEKNVTCAFIPNSNICPLFGACIHDYYDVEVGLERVLAQKIANSERINGIYQLSPLRKTIEKPSGYLVPKDKVLEFIN